VGAVIQMLRGRLTISDAPNYPKVLMTRYHQCPQAVAPLMVKYCRTLPGFVDGWVRTHRDMPELSKQFLRLAASTLPAEQLEKFPIDALRDPMSENQQLALMKKKLQGTSTRFAVLIAVAAAAFGINVWVNS
jgi:hypothetical protein